MRTEYPMWIGGEAVRTDRPRTLMLPYDGSPLTSVFDANRDHLNAAAAAAKQAAPAMRALPRAERAAILRRAREAMLARAGEFAAVVASESGKPIREARIEVDRAASTLLFSAEEAHRLTGEAVPLDAAPNGKGRWAMTVREPLGVIAAITPFNFPLNLSCHKLGPALAAGNTVVHKPASATPVSAILLAEVLQESGLPKGALNVVTGSGAEVGDPLVMHDDVAMITFTGSADVGKRIRHLAGMKRVTLELGSNSTVILAADADLDAALPRCVTGAFAHSGQVCISVQHILIAENLREEFAARFVEATKQLVIGPPLEAATEVSSLITAKEAERVVAWIGEAVRSGARLLCGGGRQNATVAPAVLENVPPNVALSCQEAFGPVVAINGFTSMEDAVARVNASPYGLQAGLYTRDLQQAFRIAGQLHVGGVHLNEVPAFRADHMPYGGVKLSGTGREGPKYAIEEMTETKLITWKV